MKTLPNIHPGEILMEEFLLPFGISLHQLSKDTAISEQHLEAIVQGKAPITGEIALRFAQYFGNSAKFWLGLQNDYDLEEAMELKKNEITAILTFKKSLAAPVRRSVTC